MGKIGIGIEKLGIGIGEIGIGIWEIGKSWIKPHFSQWPRFGEKLFFRKSTSFFAKLKKYPKWQNVVFIKTMVFGRPEGFHQTRLAELV